MKDKRYRGCENCGVSGIDTSGQQCRSCSGKGWLTKKEYEKIEEIRETIHEGALKTW